MRDNINAFEASSSCWWLDKDLNKEGKQSRREKFIQNAVSNNVVDHVAVIVLLK